MRASTQPGAGFTGTDCLSCVEPDALWPLQRQTARGCRPGAAAWGSRGLDRLRCGTCLQAPSPRLRVGDVEVQAGARWLQWWREGRWLVALLLAGPICGCADGPWGPSVGPEHGALQARRGCRPPSLRGPERHRFRLLSGSLDHLPLGTSGLRLRLPLLSLGTSRAWGLSGEVSLLRFQGA